MEVQEIKKILVTLQCLVNFKGSKLLKIEDKKEIINNLYKTIKFFKNVDIVETACKDCRYFEQERYCQKYQKLIPNNIDICKKSCKTFIDKFKEVEDV